MATINGIKKKKKTNLNLFSAYEDFRFCIKKGWAFRASSSELESILDSPKTSIIWAFILKGLFFPNFCINTAEHKHKIT